MRDFESFRELYKDCESYKESEDVMIENFGENITRIMKCDTPKERFIAALYMNDAMLENICELQEKIDNKKKFLEIEVITDSVYETTSKKLINTEKIISVEATGCGYYLTLEGYRNPTFEITYENYDKLMTFLYVVGRK